MSIDQQQDDDVYRCLVVDSGPIIKLTGMSTLWKKAKTFYTVPAVVNEIRDAKARDHLAQLPFELHTREPSTEGIQAITEFARQTGDYQSLSSVDIQVLGLMYDLEKEGCGDMNHVRKTPKRIVGLGKIETLGEDQKVKDLEENNLTNDSDGDDGSSESSEEDSEEENTEELPPLTADPSRPKSWAALLNPTGSVEPELINTKETPEIFADKSINSSFGKMNLSSSSAVNSQFCDAEESGNEQVTDTEENQTSLQDELSSDFPSLAAAAAVPYEGSDEEVEIDPETAILLDEERKRKSLKPLSKSGKLYNSFRKYSDLMKPKISSQTFRVTNKMNGDDIQVLKTTSQSNGEKETIQSHIMGGSILSGQDVQVEDDGEGWIVSTNQINTMKAGGSLDPQFNPNGLKDGKSMTDIGPMIRHRTACATTDFAMQNVILQMNLELLSVDGIKVRKLKSWVTRCGACFKVYTNTEDLGPLGKRLFCARCGSDMVQRVAASVDGKSGRLRLHLKKNYQHNLRGTKYSLPKPGAGNKFQGDLLLREDQLMTGAWSQKVKMRSGGKARNAAQSIFGADIASNVGCNAQAASADDIRVGFGRRNPNAAKGRERRGKKKKTSDKACGLRRY